MNPYFFSLSFLLRDAYAKRASSASRCQLDAMMGHYALLANEENQ